MFFLHLGQRRLPGPVELKGLSHPRQTRTACRGYLRCLYGEGTLCSLIGIAYAIPAFLALVLPLEGESSRSKPPPRSTARGRKWQPGLDEASRSRPFHSSCFSRTIQPWVFWCAGSTLRSRSRSHRPHARLFQTRRPPRRPAGTSYSPKPPQTGHPISLTAILHARSSCSVPNRRDACPGT